MRHRTGCALKVQQDVRSVDSIAQGLVLMEVETDFIRLARTCARSMPATGHEILIRNLKRIAPGLSFQQVLTRGGWYRVGGVVNEQGRRVADNLVEWIERESAGDIHTLLNKCAETPYFATRLNGQTHYLVAVTGDRACDFVQLEVEEVQEVLDRALVEPETYPDDLEELIDPVHYTRMPFEPVASCRYLLRRVTPLASYLKNLTANLDTRVPVERFLEDWDRSSAGEPGRFCKHWILNLREYTDGYGEPVMQAQPVPTFSGELDELDPDASLYGADLANLIHDFDRAAGYPMAWYFHMLVCKKVSPRVAEAIHNDLTGAYDYLPARDVKVLRDWVATPYGV